MTLCSFKCNQCAIMTHSRRARGGEIIQTRVKIMKTGCHSTKNKNLYQAKTNRSCIRAGIIKRHAAIEKREAPPHICYLPCIVPRVSEVSTSSSLCSNPCFAFGFGRRVDYNGCYLLKYTFLIQSLLNKYKERKLGRQRAGN